MYFYCLLDRKPNRFRYWMKSERESFDLSHIYRFFYVFFIELFIMLKYSLNLPFSSTAHVIPRLFGFNAFKNLTLFPLHWWIYQSFIKVEKKKKFPGKFLVNFIAYASSNLKIKFMYSKWLLSLLNVDGEITVFFLACIYKMNRCHCQNRFPT